MFTAAEKEEISLVKTSLLLELSNIMKDEQYSTELMSWIINYGVLTGGASASVFHREKPNDYDIFFEDSQTIGQVERYLATHPDYIKDLKEGYIVRESRMDGKVWSSRAITLRGNIQLIIMNTVSQRIQFDFEHCKPWLHLRTRKYFISEEQYRCIKSRTLLPSPHLIPTQHRIFKFEDRGWTLSDTVKRNPFVSPIPVDKIPVPPSLDQQRQDIIDAASPMLKQAAEEYEAKLAMLEQAKKDWAAASTKYSYDDDEAPQLLISDEDEIYVPDTLTWPGKRLTTN